MAMHISSSVEDVTKLRKGFLTTEGETTKLFYGVELEVVVIGMNYEYCDKISNSVADEIGEYAIFKPDGNFEIVTVPASLKFHKSVLWKKLIEGNIKNLTSSSDCGMHIHFSRDALTDMQLAKLFLFIHNSKNIKFLSDISGRDISKNSYCKQIMPTHYNNANDVINQYAGWSKARAIGISGRNKGHTAELRIFHSIPTEQGIFQGLEFLDAVIKYYENHGSLEKEIDYKSFIDWFIGNNMSGIYPYLDNNLKSLGYIQNSIVNVA